ncbi:hypothetical protein POX_c04439 [Penicillium oxalicum]|uniref:hypothetical protein n=1 Tax=Penicillium oxalicum TaxID=69781 RepID=UPI0020B6E03A|nr:hypothetical protein POX_c04439 [Penicillium oxalicum]KAI2791577.1 hypothetical protein POX_c04439 [Penicillium oxalicum]
MKSALQLLASPRLALLANRLALLARTREPKTREFESESPAREPYDVFPAREFEPEVRAGSRVESKKPARRE